MSHTPPGCFLANFHDHQVLIAPDKFKGTLTAPAAAAAISAGWRSARPQDILMNYPITDGGEGFGGILAPLLNCRPIYTSQMDAAHELRPFKWWSNQRTHTAVFESAELNALALFAGRGLTPFDLDSAFLGELFKDAAFRNHQNLIIGLGGSSTNDAGFGLATALGWKFLDENGKVINQWPGLVTVKDIVPPAKPLQWEHLQVGVDVWNPLLGPNGCTRVYGPQKGLKTEAQLQAAEAALTALAQAVKKCLGIDAAHLPGAGSAGGLGYGCHCFLKGHLKSGFEIFAEASFIDFTIQKSSLVITGEGALDDSSFMGKGLGQLAAKCQSMRKKCIALVGKNRLADWHRHGLSHVAGLVAPEGRAIAGTQEAFDALTRLAASVAQNLERII